MDAQECHMHDVNIKQFNRTSLTGFVVCESLGVLDRKGLYFHPK